jgi:hypothetical protein
MLIERHGGSTLKNGELAQKRRLKILREKDDVQPGPTGQGRIAIAIPRFTSATADFTWGYFHALPPGGRSHFSLRGNHFPHPGDKEQWQQRTMRKSLEMNKHERTTATPKGGRFNCLLSAGCCPLTRPTARLCSAS